MHDKILNLRVTVTAAPTGAGGRAAEAAAAVGIAMLGCLVL